MAEVEAAALAFFRDAGDAETLDRLVQSFAGIVEPMGFLSAACFHAGRPGEPISVRLAFSWNFAEDDLDKVRRRLAKGDGAVSGALMSARITAWSEIEEGSGAPQGWLIPVHGPLGETLCVAVFGGAAGPLGDRERMILQVAAGLLASHGVALAEIEVETSSDRNPTLRENECGYWAGQGKSDWQIGRILDLSEGAVGFHLSSLARKLKLKGRSEIPGLFRRLGLPLNRDN
jgi:DNA-binding CsgD family transcriptional regulator